MLGLLDTHNQETLYDFAKKTAGSWGPVFKKFLELGGKKDYERGLKEGKVAQATQQQVQQAQGTGANLAPGAGGGGLTKEKYQNMTPEEQSKLSPAEIDRLWQENTGG